MNKKLALVSIVLIALMSLTLIPAATFAWHTPCSSDDSLYEEFGPRPSLQLIKIYTDYTAELAGFKNLEVDVMDWVLSPIDYQWFEANDPTHQTWSTAFYNEFGAYQYDINCQVMPTILPSFRQAIAHMLDKQYFINTYLAGMARKMDSCLAHLPGWFNPAVTDEYNLQPRTQMDPVPNDPADWEAAYDLIVADLGPPIPDPYDPAYYTWMWPSPFPDWDPKGLFPPVPDGFLLVFARSEMLERTNQGYYLRDCIQNYMPIALAALGKPPARLHVDPFLYVAPKPTTKPQVMGYYRYHFYTGGWILGRDPDFLMYYTTGMITKPDPYGGNYVMYSNPDFDTEVTDMITSPSPGSSQNPCDGVYHAWAAQEIMEGDEPCIWFWCTAGYKAVLSNWRGVVNQAGFGLNSWWTFMNAHKVGSESCDLIRYGWCGDLLQLNIIGAQFYWDYEVLGKVYDSLISVNPYNVAEDRPWMASWEIGTYIYQGEPCTKLTYHLRNDMVWQDVPYLDRSAITYDNGHEMDGPYQCIPVTPVDVAFSVEYQRDNVNSWNGWLASDVIQIQINSDWHSMWPYDTITPPWWNLKDKNGNPVPWNYNYVTFDETNTAQMDVVMYFDLMMPWLANHWLGGLYMIPYHIWKWIPIDGSETVDCWGYDIVYGSGPWILLDRTPGVEMHMIPFRSGESYRGITLTQSGWMCLPVRPSTPHPYQYTGSETVVAGTTGQKLFYSSTIQLTGDFESFDRMHDHDVDYILHGYTFIEDQDTGLAVGGWTEVTISGNTGPVHIGTPYTYTFTLKNFYMELYPDSGWGNTATRAFVAEFEADYMVYHISSCENPFNPGCNFVSLEGCGQWYKFPSSSAPSIDPYPGYANHLDMWPHFSVYTPLTYTFWPADIAGGTIAIDDEYSYMDGIVNVVDATMVGFYWLQTPDWTPPPNLSWMDDLHIADINGDGIVNVIDATMVGFYWLQVHP